MIIIIIIIIILIIYIIRKNAHCEVFLMLCYKINRIGIRTAECRMQNRRIQNAEPPLAELTESVQKKKRQSKCLY